MVGKEGGGYIHLRWLTMKFMEFLGLHTYQSGVDADTTAMIQTPASKSEKLAMLIHMVEFEFTTHPTLDQDHTLFLVDRNVGATKKYINDPEVVAMANLIEKFTTSGLGYTSRVHTTYFNPPILYTRQTIGLQTGSSGSGVQNVGKCRVGYTLEKVSKEDYIDALVA